MRDKENIKGHNIVAVIPARSGSKGVPNKNIKLMNGIPLLAYSIIQAKSSKYITRVVVSTDSDEYAKIAREYGAETPFLRPKDISGDDSLDIDLFEHAYFFFEEHENYQVDVFVHLRPTHPIRNVQDIDKMIEMLLENDNADSIRSVSPAKFTPYKMWLFKEGGSIEPIISCGIPEAYNAPRQKLPTVFEQNACIDIVRGKTISQKHSMTGDLILGYKMKYDYDIDTEEDFVNAERILFLEQAKKSGQKLKIVCDIDGVIAEKTANNNYEMATPIKHNIKILNSLFDQGHTVVLFTARGTATGKDWKATTEKQLLEWGVKYHSLSFGKPDADFYIDDKMMDLVLFK